YQVFIFHWKLPLSFNDTGIRAKKKARKMNSVPVASGDVFFDLLAAELPASGIDIGALLKAHAALDAFGLECLFKGGDRLRGAAAVAVVLFNRIVWNQVDVAQVLFVLQKL